MTAQFPSLEAFLAMGGNAGYVFGAWGLSAAVIAALIARAIATGRREKARLARLQDEAAA